ncbi:MAG: DUF2027 domain-containing protein [Bacteroidales bacterium]|nr:DUF2027 domain-containing protein [Bacteroidales bacterium]
MTFKKGDRVKFLNDTGGGIVTRVDHQTVYVENEDGFEVPVAIPQLLRAETAESTPFTSTADKPFPADVPADAFQQVVESVPDYIDLAGAPDESNIDTSVNVLLAWVPQRKKNGKTTCDLYLVNDCGYHIMYVAAMISEGSYRGLQAGMLESDTTIHLTQIPGEDLKQISSICLEALFFRKGAYMPQEPMRYELKIDEFYLMDAVNYVTNEYFDEKALIYNISEEYLMNEIENAAREMQMRFESQKKQIDGYVPEKPAKKASESDQEEVDLHIEQLVDNPKAHTPAEMLDIQMRRFSIALEGAIRNRTKRIVFIHGVGNGRLRLEIHRALDQKYPKLRYQDASFKEYGYGATLVILK